jgi:hypothetical protein
MFIAGDRLAILRDLGLIGRGVLRVRSFVSFKLRDITLLGANLADVPIDGRFVLANVVVVSAHVGLIAMQSPCVSADRPRRSSRAGPARQAAVCGLSFARLGGLEILCLPIGVVGIVMQILAIVSFVTLIMPQVLSIL